MYYTDDPGDDEMMYMYDQNKAAAYHRRRQPKCCVCCEPIDQEWAVCIDDDWYCDDCISDLRIRCEGDD